MTHRPAHRLDRGILIVHGFPVSAFRPGEEGTHKLGVAFEQILAHRQEVGVVGSHAHRVELEDHDLFRRGVPLEGFPCSHVHDGVVEALLDRPHVGFPVAGIRESHPVGVAPVGGDGLAYFVNQAGHGRHRDCLACEVGEAGDAGVGRRDDGAELTLVERRDGDKGRSGGARLEDVAQAKRGDVALPAREHLGGSSPVVSVRDEVDVEAEPGESPVPAGQEESRVVGPGVDVFEHDACQWHGVPSFVVRPSGVVRASSTRAHRSWNRLSLLVSAPRGRGRSMGMERVTRPGRSLMTWTSSAS